jgi:hypothetical protein
MKRAAESGEDDQSDVKISKIDEKPKFSCTWQKKLLSLLSSGSRIALCVESEFESKTVKEWIPLKAVDVSYEGCSVVIEFKPPSGTAYHHSNLSLVLFERSAQKLLLDKIAASSEEKRSEKHYSGDGVEVFCKLSVSGKKTVERLVAKGVYMGARHDPQMQELIELKSKTDSFARMLHNEPLSYFNIRSLYDITYVKVCLDVEFLNKLL